jgi:breast cancer 2 susceptibility protein
MVLAVSRIVLLGAAASHPVSTGGSADVEADASLLAVVEVTDGWYTMEARLDAQLSVQLALGRLRVGQKLRIFGAELEGPEGGAHPLEPAARALRLRLCINATRRALWHARLGFQPVPAFPVNLRSLRLAAGPVPMLDLLILRRYPLLVLDSSDPVRRVVRTLQAEERLREDLQEVLQDRLEARLEQLAHASAHSDEDPELLELLRGLGDCQDPEEQFFEPSSSPATADRAERQQRERERERWQAELRERLARQVCEQEPAAHRVVTPFLALRVADASGQALLTIWRPSEELLERLLHEGARLRVCGLRVAPARPAAAAQPLATHAVASVPAGRLLQLSSSAQTRWLPLDPLRPLYSLPRAFEPRRCAAFSELSGLAPDAEFDVVALVVEVRPPENLLGHDGRPYTVQHVLFADAQMVLVCSSLTHFWSCCAFICHYTPCLHFT